MSNHSNQTKFTNPADKESMKAIFELTEKIEDKFGELLDIALNYEIKADPDWQESFRFSKNAVIPQFSRITVENLGIQITEWEWFDTNTAIVKANIALGNICDYFAEEPTLSYFQPIRNFEFIYETAKLLPLGVRIIEVNVDLEFLLNPSTKTGMQKSIDFAKAQLSWIESYVNYLQYFT